MTIKHYWFYPIAYVYGSDMCLGKQITTPVPVRSYVYSIYIGDTSFCNPNTYCVVKKDAYCLMCQHLQHTDVSCDHPHCPKLSTEGKT